MHTGSHKLNNALGQALLAKRMGKPRIIAETGAGQHGVATATACALLGLECVVYMGAEDMRRQQPNVQRMRAARRDGRAASTPGSRTLKEAVSEAIRDWVANVGDTHYVIGSCVGPAPYPALVRDLQRVIGDEARAQILERAGRLPERVIACVGGGSNAIGTFIPFVDDAARGARRRRGGGGGARDRPPRRAAHRRRPRRRAARRATRRSCRTRRARSPRRTRSRPASTTPARARARLAARQRAARATSRSPTTRRVDAFRRLAALEGIIPALESSHALAWVLAEPPRDDDELDLVCLSGRGDKDLAEVLERSDEHRDDAGSRRSRPRSRRSGKRAALMPYLMGGFPTLEGSRAIGEAYADGGRGPRRARRPVLRPARRRPGDPRRGHRGARGGRDARTTSSRSAGRSRSRSRSCSCATPTSCSRAAPERFADELAQRGVSGLIVPDLPLEEADGALAACDAAGLALVPLVAPTTPPTSASRRSAPGRAASSTRSRSPARPASAAALAGDLPGHPGPHEGGGRRPRRARVRHRRRPRRRPPRPTRAPTASSSAPGSCAPRRRASSPRTRCVGWWPGSPQALR